MKKIIIGIDISKEKLDATAIDVRSGQLQIIKLGYQTFENRPMGFRKMLVWSRHLLAEAGLEDVLFCCETTGGFDRGLCDYIYTKGLDIWRESALQIKQSSGIQPSKMQKTAKSIFQFFARLHFLTQIFAHSRNRCEASKE